jgi:response regulator RpfG family c-di-GMP phosphodiesterase
MLERILLVEDHLGIRKNLASFLRTEGYEVNEASKLNLVLSDIVMPELSGFSLLQHVRLVRPRHGEKPETLRPLTGHLPSVTRSFATHSPLLLRYQSKPRFWPLIFRSGSHRAVKADVRSDLEESLSKFAKETMMKNLALVAVLHRK